MAPTPVRHVRVADPLWDAAKAKAGSEYRTVADVIVECLRRYVATGEPPVLDAAASLSVASVEAHAARVAALSHGSPAVGTGEHEDIAGGHVVGTADTDGPPPVGTAGNGQATAVPTPAPHARKPGSQSRPRIAVAAGELGRELMAPARGAGKPAGCTHSYPDVRSIAGVDVCRKCG